MLRQSSAVRNHCRTVMFIERYTIFGFQTAVRPVQSRSSAHQRFRFTDSAAYRGLAWRPGLGQSGRGHRPDRRPGGAHRGGRRGVPGPCGISPPDFAPCSSRAMTERTDAGRIPARPEHDRGGAGDSREAALVRRGHHCVPRTDRAVPAALETRSSTWRRRPPWTPPGRPTRRLPPARTSVPCTGYRWGHKDTVFRRGAARDVRVPPSGRVHSGHHGHGSRPPGCRGPPSTWGGANTSDSGCNPFGFNMLAGAGAESVGPRAGHGRLVQRLRRGGGGPPGLRKPRRRHRRLGTPAGQHVWASSASSPRRV